MTISKAVIKRLATQSGLDLLINDGEGWENLQKFANAIAAHERNEIKYKLLEIGALEDGDYIDAIIARSNSPL